MSLLGLGKIKGKENLSLMSRILVKTNIPSLRNVL